MFSSSLRVLPLLLLTAILASCSSPPPPSEGIIREETPSLPTSSTFDKFYNPNTSVGLENQSYSPELCEEVGKLRDFYHYWRCIEGDILLTATGEVQPVPPELSILALPPNFNYPIRFLPGDEVRLIEGNLGLVPAKIGRYGDDTFSSLGKGFYLTSLTDSLPVGYFVTKAEDFSIPEMVYLLDPASPVIPARVKVDNDTFIGFLFQPVPVCDAGTSCKKLSPKQIHPLEG